MAIDSSSIIARRARHALPSVARLSAKCCRLTLLMSITNSKAGETLIRSCRCWASPIAAIPGGYFECDPLMPVRRLVDHAAAALRESVDGLPLPEPARRDPGF